MLLSLLYCAVVIAVLMFGVWLASVWLADVSIVDIAWGGGFVLVVWTAFLTQTRNETTWLLPILTTVWGLRLSGHLLWRNHGKQEDFRYQAMRERWGSRFPVVSLFTVFGLQGMVLWVVSLPLQTAFIEPAGTTSSSIWLQIVGTLLWATGMVFEALGDWQLAQFKSNPENQEKVLDTGLWRYTRHPNYFGDFLVWWGLFAVAVASSQMWWTVIGPLTMSIFLMRISGVTLLEKSLKKSKPDYNRYVQSTNAFWPGPPR